MRLGPVAACSPAGIEGPPAALPIAAPRRLAYLLSRCKGKRQHAQPRALCGGPSQNLELEMAQTPVELTESAAGQIGEILKSEPEGSFLRIGVEGGGCSGFSYTYSIARDLAPDDLVVRRGCRRDRCGVARFPSRVEDRFHRQFDGPDVQDRQSARNCLLRLRNKLRGLRVDGAAPLLRSSIIPVMPVRGMPVIMVMAPVVIMAVVPRAMIVPRVESQGSVHAAHRAADSTAHHRAERTGGPAPLRSALLHAPEDALGVSHGRHGKQSRGGSEFQHLEHLWPPS